MTTYKQLAKIKYSFLVCLTAFLLSFSFTSYAYIPDVNDQEVFLGQGGTNECTLISQIMMLRRAAILSDDENWSDITRDVVRPQAWVNGKGVKYNYTFTYSDDEGSLEMSVSKQPISGDVAEKSNQLMDLLDSHEEGIVLYLTKNSNACHAVTLTSYDFNENGDVEFFCVDPYQSQYGITSLTASQLGRDKYSNGTQSSILKNCKNVYVICG